jgi:hypothetical protein
LQIAGLGVVYQQSATVAITTVRRARPMTEHADPHDDRPPISAAAGAPSPVLRELRAMIETALLHPDAAQTPLVHRQLRQEPPSQNDNRARRC